MMKRNDELAAVKAQCLMQVQQLWSRMDGRERSHFLKTLMGMLLRRRNLPESRQQKLSAQQKNDHDGSLTPVQQSLILNAASATDRLSASGGNCQP